MRHIFCLFLLICVSIFDIGCSRRGRALEYTIDQDLNVRIREDVNGSVNQISIRPQQSVEEKSVMLVDANGSSVKLISNEGKLLLAKHGLNIYLEGKTVSIRPGLEYDSVTSGLMLVFKNDVSLPLLLITTISSQEVTKALGTPVRVNGLYGLQR